MNYRYCGETACPSEYKLRVNYYEDLLQLKNYANHKILNSSAREDPFDTDIRNFELLKNYANHKISSFEYQWVNSTLIYTQIAQDTVLYAFHMFLTALHNRTNDALGRVREGIKPRSVAPC